MQDLKAEVIRRCLTNEVRVFTDPKASPTGFPFKVVGLPGSVSEASVVAERTRVCDLGYLRELAIGVNALMVYEPRKIIIESGDGTRQGGENGVSGFTFRLTNTTTGAPTAGITSAVSRSKVCAREPSR